MKFTLNWLKEHLDTDADLTAILDALNRIGHEVEGVENPGAELAAFKVARVLTAAHHAPGTLSNRPRLSPRRRPPIALVPAVLQPLPRVAQHVVQPEGIGCEAAHRRGEGKTVAAAQGKQHIN